MSSFFFLMNAFLTSFYCCKFEALITSIHLGLPSKSRGVDASVEEPGVDAHSLRRAVVFFLFFFSSEPQLGC